MVIYADVLILLNLYINYFLIRAAAVMLRRKVSPKRCLLAASAGAAASLIMLLPELPFAASAAIKTALCAGITFIAFGRQRFADFAVSALCLTVISFVFAGAMLALWCFFAPLGMQYRNGTAYFDIPIAAAALFTAAAYAVIRLVRRLLDRKPSGGLHEVIIRRGAVSVTLKGLADTGNSLRDVFTGKPVVVCFIDKVTGITPDSALRFLSGERDKLDGIRLLPCSTITSDGVIPVFAADSVIITGKTVDAYVGVTSRPIGGADCLFDPGITLL